MAELVQKVDNLVKDANVQMTRYRALETMQRKDYNPVEKLIEIAEMLANNRRTLFLAGSTDLDARLETQIHTKLLEYYSAAPKKQMEMEINSNQSIVVMPVGMSHLYEGKDLTPCKPKIIDVTPKKTETEKFFDAS